MKKNRLFSLLSLLFTFSIQVSYGQLTENDLTKIQSLTEKMLEYSTALNNSTDENIIDSYYAKMISTLQELMDIYSKDALFREMTNDLKEQLNEIKAEQQEIRKQSNNYNVNDSKMNTQDANKKMDNNKVNSNCNDLLIYRDGQLFNDFDKAVKKYDLLRKHKEDIANWKANLLDETKWHRTDASAYVGAVALATKTTTDLINGLLSYIPAGSTGTWADRIMKGLDAGQKINSVVEKGVEATAYEIILDLNPVGKTINIIMNTAENLKRFEEIDLKKVEELRKEVNEAVVKYEAAITMAEEEMNKELHQMNCVEQIKQGIDDYIRKNCK